MLLRVDEGKGLGESLVGQERIAVKASRYNAKSVFLLGFVSENGNDLNDTLSKMSPLNPSYLTKKATVFQQVSDFVAKFKGVGGQI